MLAGPFCSGILMPMPKSKCIDLLLQLLQCQLMVIPHPKIFFDSIVFTRRDIDRMITSIAQTLSDKTCVTLICFDTLSLLRQHSCRSKDDTFYSGVRELII